MKNKAVAVISKSYNFFDIALSGVTPRKKFVVVTRKRDCFGIRFDGVILLPNWYENPEAVAALEEIKKRQPELFDAKKCEREE